MKIKLPSNERLVAVACVLALVALALMNWSLVSPTVWPIMIAISLGQVIGTASFALFLLVVARDLGLAAVLVRLRGGPSSAPPGGSK